jgi:glucose/arabinose dehydrogenase
MNKNGIAAVWVVSAVLAALIMGAARAGASALDSASPTGNGEGVIAVEIANGLAYPVAIAHTGIVTDTRLFVVERAGSIRVVRDDGTVLATPYLNIEAKVQDTGIEEGLLSMAFHPDFANNLQFFVYYVNNNGNVQLSRFSAPSVESNAANTDETILLEVPHPNNNHNGGMLSFGPDGYLYVSIGDGGGSGDPNNRAQNLGELLGKALRLNVTGVPTYTVPANNPFVGVEGARGEIWAYGLRNPWRATFDRETGDYYIADVGQHELEEINFQPAASLGGENYGWRCYEGFLPFNPEGCGPPESYVFPVHAYPLTGGNRAITGGYVYRGEDNPGMYGYYFFADYGSGRFWAMQPGSWLTVSLPGVNVGSPSSFGEDARGELYVTSIFSGRLYRLQGNVQFNAIYLPLISR